jgi:hypothetical protein
MNTIRRFLRPVSIIVGLAFLPLSLYMPAAQAAMISTDVVVVAVEAEQARHTIEATLAREDVKQALLEQGVKPEDVQARVAALSDEEAAQVAAQLDAMPAGGDGLGLVVFLFLVLLVTDILCLTNIFPFVVKHCR